MSDNARVFIRWHPINPVVILRVRETSGALLKRLLKGPYCWPVFRIKEENVTAW
jgi:hypothetical protein